MESDPMIQFLPATMPCPNGLRRPDDPPDEVISPGVLSHRGREMIYGWHFNGPWPHHCVQDGVNLYYGHTIEELRLLARQ